MASKGNPSRVFVRVRPFTSGEERICAEGQVVPREAIAFDGRSTLTILDPQNNFEPRKNGVFTPVDVLWSFKGHEEQEGVKVLSQKDVYQKVVTPMMSSIVDGYSAAFCIAGGSGTGRNYTLYGDDVDGNERGILPRFAEDIFDAFEKQKQENSIVLAEMEAVDVSGETFVDLLAIRRSKTGAADAGDLKVQMGPEGARLSGVTTTEIKGSHDFRAMLKQLNKTAKKRNCTHTVTLRFTESFEFDDPENNGQSVTKSRRVQVVFVILRNLPAAFQRVVDVAVEHDSGENPMAKVPTRETALTRLHPGLFTQGFNVTFVNCLSPYYEQVRENLNTLIFSLKVQKLRGKPQLNQDESLLDLRRLADEVKGLKVTVRKQSEAMQVVQKELNAREVELMKQEARYNEANTGLQETQEKIHLTTVSRNMEVDKTNRVRKEMSKELAAKKKEMQTVQSDKAAKDKAAKDFAKATDDAKVRTEYTEKKIKNEEAKTRAHQDTVKAFEDDKAHVAHIKYINTASPEEQRAEFIATSDLHKEDEKAIARLKEEIKAVKASDSSAPQIKEISAEYQQAYNAEAPCREKEALLKEIKQLEKEIADAEAETKRLQAEIDEKKAQCCSTM